MTHAHEAFASLTCVFPVAGKPGTVAREQMLSAGLSQDFSELPIANLLMPHYAALVAEFCQPDRDFVILRHLGGEVTAHRFGPSGHAVSLDSGVPTGSGLRFHLGEQPPEALTPDDVYLHVDGPALRLTFDRSRFTDLGLLRRLEGLLYQADLGAPVSAAGGAALWEPRLAELWQGLLAIPQVTRGDDFFALGGHSLLATRLVSQLRGQYEVIIEIRDVFDNPTLEGLSALVAARVADGSAMPVQVVVRDLRPSLPQERIWFLSRLHPETNAYNFQAALRLRGTLDVSVLEETLTEIVRRHEMLRTTFADRQGRPELVVHEPWQVTIPVEETGGEAAAMARAGELTDVHFDTTELPLIRWRLLRLAPGDHVLVQVEHHFVHDGWSLAVLLGEINAIYPALRAGRGHGLPELQVQFADIATAQRALFEGARRDADLAFWRGYLADLPPALEFPADQPRPPWQSFRGSVHRQFLPLDLYRQLSDQARAAGATPYMLLLSAFCVLLERHTGQRDVVLAAGVANRRLPGSEPLIGMLVNTVAVRIGLCGADTFSDLLRRARRSTLDAFAHQETPFEQVLAAAGAGRDPSVNSLHQVMFSFHDSAVPDIALPDLTGELTILHNGTAKADLNVVVMPRPEQRAGQARPDDSVLVWWEFNTDIFGPQTVARMADRFLALLRAVAQDVTAKLDDLPGLGPAEARDLAGPVTEPYALVPQEIAARLAEDPEAIAVVGADGTTLTRRALDAAAGRLAGQLLRLGVSPEDRVALALARTPQWVAAQLACWRVGAAFVPLDNTAPAARLRQIIADSGAAVVLTDGTTEALSTMDTDIRVLLAVTSGPAEPTAGPGSALIAGESVTAGVAQPAAIHAGQLAYVIYTSGSSGAPKGVAIEHSGLANLVGWHRRRWELGPTDAVSCLAGLGFDAAVWEVHPALAAGARIYLAPEHVRMDGELLVRWWTERGVTVAFAPTPLAEWIFEALGTGRGALRTLLVGGDRLLHRPPADIGVQVVNAYGPTENSVVTAAGVVASHGTGPPDIGTALDNQRLYIVDSRGRPVPPGASGELYAGGQGPARGYLGSPGLTAAAFLPDPGQPGGRRYRTGDRVRLRADGALDFLGRQDHQVKLRGFRIELGEIEAALAACAGVAAAAVVLDEREQRLTGYVVSASRVDVKSLSAQLAERLPRYMVPTAWAVLDRMPVTANGKVDRAALPEPDLLPELASGGPARTDTERLIAKIWAEVLCVGIPGRDDDFFVIGGHSLAAIQVVAQLGKPVPVRLMFEDPVLWRFAEVVEGYAVPDLPAGPAPDLDVELSAAQLTELFGQGRS